MDEKDSIILIGPMHIGKSTMAIRLWNKYLYNFVNCDYYFDYYYRKTNTPRNYFKDLLQKKGIEASFQETDPFCADFVMEISQLVHETNTMSIIDFGGNHTAYFDEKCIEKVKNELQYYKNILLLLPYEDRKQSFEHFERMIRDPFIIELNKKIYDSQANKEFASKTFYTGGLSEEQLFEQIDTYLNTKYNLKRAEIPSVEKALRIRRIINGHFPDA